MIRFLGDMVIGWIIYTDSGKKMANMVMNTAINKIKSNVSKTLNNKDFKALKDSILGLQNEQDKSNREE